LAVSASENQADTLDKVNSIVKYLKNNYKYSLSFKRNKNVDPVIDFIFNNKQGHCEYFASAFTLLVRSLGIPARVVAGYSVSEYNPVGTYYIVREKNAHAWAEVWIDKKGWVTFDPTPSLAVSTDQSLIVSILDLLPAYFNKGIERIASLGKLKLFLIVSGIIIIWIIVKIIYYLKQRTRIKIKDSKIYKNPGEGFIKLLHELEKNGVKRETGEPLELFEKRVALFNKNGKEAATLIRSYIIWRYGNRGDIKKISHKIDQWILK